MKRLAEEMPRLLPVVETKPPQNIVELQRDREDIKLLLESMQEQLVKGKISRQDYEGAKVANLRKLEQIRTSLEGEWRKLEQIATAEREKLPQQVAEVKAKQDEIGKVVEEATKKLAGIEGKLASIEINTAGKEEKAEGKSLKKKSKKPDETEEQRKRRILSELKRGR